MCSCWAPPPPRPPNPLTREHAARAVLAPNVRELVVVLHEKVEVLPGHIHLQVGAARAVLLQRGAAAAERVTVDLGGRGSFGVDGG
jgi:hypothetical protein